MLQANPELSAQLVFDELVAQELISPGEIKPSTFYRFRKAKRLHKKPAQAKTDRKAFSFDHPNDCWQFDTLYGPHLANVDGSRSRTYLYAILDDATRLICHGQFYTHHGLPPLQDCLKQALLKRGVPKKLYVDNAQIFSSRPMLLSCAELGIQLIHSKPYTPQVRIPRIAAGHSRGWGPPIPWDEGHPFQVIAATQTRGRWPGDPKGGRGIWPQVRPKRRSEATRA